MNQNICACKKNNKCWLTIMTSLAVKSLKQVDSTTEFWPHGDRSKFFICIMRGSIESETSMKATGPKAWVYDSCKTTGRASIFWSKFCIANLNVFTKENRKAGRQEILFLPLARLQRRFRTNSCPGPVFAFSGTCLPQKICKNQIGEVCYQPWVTKTELKFLTKMKGKLDKIPNIIKCLSEKKVKQATFSDNKT